VPIRPGEIADRAALRDATTLTIVPALLAGAVLVTLGILSSRLALRLGVPALLLFMGLGMLAGSEGIGGIAFADPALAQSIGVVALAVILFDGGLSTRWETIKPVVAQGVALATVAVAITAGITGTVAAWVLDVPIEVGLLLGAIVSSTDAAAVFSVLRSRNAGLKGHIQPTLELESGANDPMAVFLTIGLIEVLTGPGTEWWSLLPLLATQFALGAALGLAAGWAARHLLNHAGLGIEGLYPVLTLAVGALTFAGTTLLGGSGFLAVYVCGLVLGNADVLHRNSILRFHDAIAWLAQIAMFLVLGMLAFPSALVDSAGRSLLLVAVLAFVARPLATVVTLAPFRVPLREQAVIAWVGLRGATPIVLATFPLVEGVEGAGLLFNVVFFVVLVSVLLQGTTLDTVARLLDATVPVPNRTRAPLEAGQPLPDGTALRELEIPRGSVADGAMIVDLHLPKRALLVLVERDGTYIVPTGSTTLAENDIVLLLADADAMEQARQRLADPDEVREGGQP
jgi:cell volume regulation protein A